MGARKVVVALTAGCTVVMKTDGLTPFSSNVMAVLGERAGVPKGVFNIVTSFEEHASAWPCHLSSMLKKLSLELGGNAPFIVFNDADLEVAITSILLSKFKVTGQTCVCANRIFVQEGIYERFSQRLVEEISKFRVGNGFEALSVTHGPLTNGVTKVEEHINDAISKNAKVLLGGNRLPSLGKNFHELTTLGDANDSMLVASEETFGPVAALMRFSTEDEVIRRANDCSVGLASYIMTSDLARSHRVSERPEYGMVAINTGVISDAPAPFGGVKHSGMGREGSNYGLEDYMTIKMIVTGGINTVYKL
ncbi:hypothetical protein BBP40_011435 [Aspergillus hancockii]|nr:hypothetical protein BBP40_011435 [Aspergillus hancockii]